MENNIVELIPEKHKRLTKKFLEYFDNVNCDECYLYKNKKCRLGEVGICEYLKDIFI